MKNKAILTLLALGALISCEEPKPKRKAAIMSFELSYSNDTINVIDSNDWKQGVWVTRGSKDTMVYRNDTGYSTQGTTARELIRTLSEERKR